MTPADRLRAARALQADWDKLDEIEDAVRALQSTDAACLLPLHDKYVERLNELKAMVRTRYVLGFAFTDSGEKVVLIRKGRPAYQKDRLNGLGGRVNDAETLIDAMTREFEQECGLRVDQQRWIFYSTMLRDNAEITCYTCDLKTGEHVDTKTDEEVGIYPVSELYGYPLVPHVDWLVPLARDKSMMPATLKIR